MVEAILTSVTAIGDPGTGNGVLVSDMTAFPVGQAVGTGLTTLAVLPSSPFPDAEVCPSSSLSFW